MRGRSTPSAAKRFAKPLEVRVSVARGCSSLVLSAEPLEESSLKICCDSGILSTEGWVQSSKSPTPD